MVIAFIILIVILAALGFAGMLFKFTSSLKCILSFKELFDITNLPIVPLIHNNKTFYFLLDTGSSDCIIDKKVIDEFKYEKLDLTDRYLYGMEGNIVKVDSVRVELEAGNNKISGVFLVTEMPAFENLTYQHRKVKDIKVSGIVGGSLLKEYGFIIDYADFNLKMYEKDN